MGWNKPYGMIGGMQQPGRPGAMGSLVEGSQSMLNGMQQRINFFGRISELLHMNFDALHMSFTSLLQLISNSEILMHECRGVFGTFSGLRVLYLIYRRVYAFVMRMIGRSDLASQSQFQDVWKRKTGQSTGWSWVPSLLAVSATLWLLKRLIFGASSSSPRLETSWSQASPQSGQVHHQQPHQAQGIPSQGFSSGWSPMNAPGQPPMMSSYPPMGPSDPSSWSSSSSPWS